MEEFWLSAKGKITFEVLSNPEFMAEGTAISDLKTQIVCSSVSRETERGLKSPRGTDRYLCPVGSCRKNNYIQYLEFRTIQTCRQRFFGAAGIIHQLYFRFM